jgi:hypothetical protein
LFEKLIRKAMPSEKQAGCAREVELGGCQARRPLDAAARQLASGGGAVLLPMARRQVAHSGGHSWAEIRRANDRDLERRRTV